MGNLGYSLDSHFLVASISLTIEKVRRPTLLQELSKCWGEGKHGEAKKKDNKIFLSKTNTRVCTLISSLEL